MVQSFSIDQLDEGSEIGRLNLMQKRQNRRHIRQTRQRSHFEKPTVALIQPTTKPSNNDGTSTTVATTGKTAVGVVSTDDNSLVLMIAAVMVGGFVSAYLFSVSRKRRKVNKL